MNKTIASKLKELPTTPGVYFHKDAAGEIIYIGKAANLRNRVRQYFQASRGRDPKTEALVGEIADTEWVEVDSEIDALFLEAELVRRYLPRYNILLRDDKAMSYIRIDYDSDYPTVSTTRRPLDDGARYFGPYLSTLSIRQALKLLRRVFPFATRRVPGQKRATLHYHLGLDPGLEEGKTSLRDYRTNLRRLMAVIEGKRSSIEKELEKDMKTLAKASKFEAAARVRNQLYALQNLNRYVIFSDKEFLDISKDHALGELVDLLGLAKFPQRIEGYDISHMSGTDVVASMVVFTNGASNKREYRKFKTRKDHNDDFYNMHETIGRRLTLPARGPSSSSSGEWKLRLPNLILIDGGKGQLDAALRARGEAVERCPDLRKGRTLAQIPFIGLAKREEQIVVKKRLESRGMSQEVGSSNVKLDLKVLNKLGGVATESEEFTLINLPHSTNLVKLLQRIRDESHRFAVSYHNVLKVKRQTASLLDDIPGIGPATRKKLIRTFGSMKGIMEASEAELDAILRKNKADIIKSYFASQKIEP